MNPDKLERYGIAQVPEGLHISIWQALPRFGLGVMVLVIMAALFLTDPYQGHIRIWAGLGVVALAVVALFGVRVESWVVADTAVRYKSSLWSRELVFERRPGTPLTARVELVRSDSEGNELPFPHVVHLIAPGGTNVGDGFRFRERSSALRFLDTLQEIAPVEVWQTLQYIHQ